VEDALADVFYSLLWVVKDPHQGGDDAFLLYLPVLVYRARMQVRFNYASPLPPLLVALHRHDSRRLRSRDQFQILQQLSRMSTLQEVTTQFAKIGPSMTVRELSTMEALPNTRKDRTSPERYRMSETHRV